MNTKQISDICQDCHDICLDILVNYCYVQGGEYTNPHHLKIMDDCIEICETTANFLRRNSEFSNEVCAPCASICYECANSCANLPSREMQKCAEIARQCAQSCEQLARVRQFA